jgi:hypothetical protein
MLGQPRAERPLSCSSADGSSLPFADHRFVDSKGMVAADFATAAAAARWPGKSFRYV